MKLELISRDMDLWAGASGVTLDFSRPGEPTDNAFIEACDGRFRAERLNAHRLPSLADAREKSEDRRKYCNMARPRFGPGCRAPAPGTLDPPSDGIVPWASAPAVDGARSPTSNVASDIAMH